VGIDDPEWGQRVAAIVEAEPDGRVPSLTELRDLLSETLARHELPRSLTVVRSLPRLTGGKIDRRAAALLAD
jgi:acyl-CoA synthetase (AMP-forming)/AMP-acid ligase II